MALDESTAQSEDGTRERLLQAAGEVFAEHGFRAATVRDICGRAKVNLAAVNYHFRDKEGLYAEVLKYAHRYALETYPPTRRPDAAATPEQRLRIFVYAFLRRILDEGRPAWHGKLMAREIVEPTAALDTVVARSIRPQQDVLVSIVRDLAGPDVPASKVQLCVFSVVGQCLHFYLARPVITRLYPSFTYSPEQIEELADHVTEFSLAAIKHLSQESTQP